MPPEERNRERTIFGNGHDRRLHTLVAKRRRDRPHQDPGRADADDRAPGFEQRPNVAGRVVEADVGLATDPGIRDPGAKPVDLGVAERPGDPARERRAIGVIATSAARTPAPMRTSGGARAPSCGLTGRYSSTCMVGPCRNRTCDHLIKSQMLYRLS